jgi:thioredoxin 1
MTKRLVILLIMLASLVFISGCAEKTQEKITNLQNVKNNSTSSQNVQDKSVVVEATKLKQINTSLQKGPVLLEIGEKGCDDCQAMKPILAQVAADYGKKSTVMSVDMDKSPKLAEYFGAYFVPVSFVIFDNKNGNYTYIRENGNVSRDEFEAKIIGPRAKDVLEKLLDIAIQQEKNKTKKDLNNFR